MHHRSHLLQTHNTMCYFATNHDFMDAIIKIGKFVFAFLWLVSLIGGTAYHIFRGDAFFGVLNVIVCVALIPTIKTFINDLVNGPN